MRDKLQDNLRIVRERIAAACDRVKRDPASVTLVAVTKYVGVDVIRMLMDLGMNDLGENRVQELVGRAAMIHRNRDLEMSPGGQAVAPRWHMIGNLQRNKVKSLLPWVTMIHSVDRLRVAEEISRRAVELDRQVDVLLEVNGGNEPQKSGAAVCAAPHLGEQVASLPGVRLRGLMTMAPYGVDARALRNIYQRVSELFHEMRHDFAIGGAFDTYSAGMTQDFEIAVECGATTVRIGTALFDGLPGEARKATLSAGEA